MNKSPVFIGGLSRSGKTYLRFMLSAHPNLAISKRTNLWTQHYRRFDRLDRPENLERCLSVLAKSKHIRSLGIDFDQLRLEFALVEPSYEKLFALIHEQYAASEGKPRWGDQTEELEKIAPAILAAFPEARFLHLIRDPRDRYHALLEKNQTSGAEMRTSLRGGGLGAATARWLASASLAVRHLRSYPYQYKVVRYEALVSSPVETLQGICEFLGEEYHPQMLEMRAEKRFANRAESEDGSPSPLSTEYIGRFRRGLSDFEIAFIQQRTKGWMQVYGYALEPVHIYGLSVALDWVFSTASLLGWQMREMAAR